MTDTERLKEWQASVELYRKNAEGLGFKTRVRVKDGSIKIANNACEEYKQAINQLSLYIADCYWVLDLLIDPYCFTLKGFAEELYSYMPTILEIIFNEGYEAFVIKLFQIENCLCLKYCMPDIKMINGVWTLTVRFKDGEKVFYRKNGHFEDEEGKVFSKGMGFESLFWNLFDDKSEYKIPIINNSNITNVNDVA